MKSADDIAGLAERLENKALAIALLVWRRRHIWIHAPSECFYLNFDFTIAEEVRLGKTDPTRAEQLKAEFRGGIGRLDGEHVERFLALDDVRTLSVAEAQDILFHDIEEFAPMALEAVEAWLAFDDRGIYESVLEDVAMTMNDRLPVFYVNYDKKLFRHRFDRLFYHDAALEGWSSRLGPFLMLIPNHVRYWVREGLDYWAMTEDLYD